MSLPPEQRTCLVTGANGYLGRHVCTALEQRGWRVVELSRHPAPGDRAIHFELGGKVAPSALAGAQALVQCAYDRSWASWEAVRSRNVEGTEQLFRAARAANVANLVLISTLSAFDGCRSLYGKAKLETERIAQSYGAIILRPGLIFGDPSGGIFARLVSRVARARVLPSFGGASALYLVHHEDLTRLICRCAEGEIRPSTPPIAVAHQQPWTLRQIIEELARARGRTIVFVPVPWRAMWALLKCRELCRLPMEFASDSLVSLMHQKRNPSFALQDEFGIVCRPFGMAAKP